MVFIKDLVTVLIMWTINYIIIFHLQVQKHEM